MLISFSGLGGSGKSTHIEVLTGRLRERGIPVRVVAVRDLFWWPKLAVWSHGPQHPVTEGVRPVPVQVATTSLKGFIRLIFYFLDSWRIYLGALRPRVAGEVVIADRYFYDFFSELEFGRTRVSGLARFFLALLPAPRLAFYFHLDPAEAQQRKYEYPIPILALQQLVYESIMSRTPHVRVRAIEPLEPVAGALCDIVVAARDLGVSSRSAYTWYLHSLYGRVPVTSSLSKTVMASVPFDLGSLLEAAIANRMLWFLVCVIVPGRGKLPAAEAQQLDERLARIIEKGEALERRRARTLDALAAFNKKTGIETHIVKDAGAIDQGTDIDIVVRTAADLSALLEYAAAQHWQVHRVDASKADLHLGDDALPIDVHLDTRYHGFRYVSSEFLWRHPREAEALVIISHAVNELTLVTLGDILKLKVLEEQGIDWQVAREEAARNGWGGALARWLSVSNDPKLVARRLPYQLSTFGLFFGRLRRYFHALDGRPGADLYDLTRSLRARSMGKIPFHEPWARESSR